MTDNRTNTGMHRITKRELELQKIKAEEEATANVYREFVDSFDKTVTQGISRCWVRGGVVNEIDNPQEPADRFYQPKQISDISVKTNSPPKTENTATNSVKRKTNIESLKIELKKSQNELDKRLRHNLAELDNNRRRRRSRFSSDTPIGPLSSHDSTTCICIPALESSVTESELVELFGQFGCLGSVRIEEGSPNSARVVYMNRLDAERAWEFLQGRMVKGVYLRMSWGGAVPLACTPVYVPPHLRHPPANKDQVVIPSDRTLLCLIHRMIEFVLREGPHFEYAIMQREVANPLFKFLFDMHSPEHVYYRWKLFSLLQGNGLYHWRTAPFRMFSEGPTCVPPSPPNYGGNALILTKLCDINIVPAARKDGLSPNDLLKLEELLGSLTSSRSSVGEVMCWCIQHAEYARDIVMHIARSFSCIPAQTDMITSRMYLVSDILYNSGSKVSKAAFYRQHFETVMEDIVLVLQRVHKSFDDRLKGELFKHKIINCFRAWEEWSIYSNDVLIRFQNIFLDLVSCSVSSPDQSYSSEGVEMDIDGVPMEDQCTFVAVADSPEDIDGVPLPDDFDMCGWAMDDSADKTIELRTMEYQDDVEAGIVERDYGMSVLEQVDNYRKSLMSVLPRQ